MASDRLEKAESQMKTVRAENLEVRAENIPPQQVARAENIPSQPSFHQLSNGLRVACWPQPHLHSVGVGLYVRVGSRFETLELSGISHFLEHVLFRGNDRYKSSLDMNRTFESWGGEINGYTTREYTYFFGKLHADYILQAIQFMSDFIREPVFGAVDLERKIILEERLDDVDSDGQDLDVDDLSRQTFWKNHPMGYKIIGVPKALKRIKEKDLREHFKEYYVLNNITLVLTGRFDLERSLEELEKAFKGMPIGKLAHPPSLGNTKLKQQSVFINSDSSQVSLQLSFRAPAPGSPNYPAMVLLDRILDDGMSSRLWQRLVEEKGLCYDLWSDLEVYHDITMMDFGASVAPEKLIQLIEGIYEQLTLMREEGPTQEELDLACRRRRFQMEYILDQVSTLNESLGISSLYDFYTPLEKQIEALNAVTTEQVRDFSREFLTANNHLLAVVGPVSKNTKRYLRNLAKNF